MIKEIQDNLFCIKVPLPGTALRNLNSYVIRSPERNLIIDTGMNQRICRETMFKALDTLGVDLDRTDIFLTHFHADHIGLVHTLSSEKTKIYCHSVGWELIKEWTGFEAWFTFAEKHGFPKGELQRALDGHPGHNFRCNWKAAIQFMADGDVIKIGDWLLVVTETPGHSKDHLCLYEPARKFLFSGDHILDDITPNIQCWTDDGNPLRDYLKSLEKTSAMEITLVLPAHRRFIRDHRRRIKELQAHHDARLAEIEDILTVHAKSAYQIASKMTWSIDGDCWDHFPAEQRWFATVETISHLNYLTTDGLVKMHKSGNGILYSNDERH